MMGAIRESRPLVLVKAAEKVISQTYDADAEFTAPQRVQSASTYTIWK